MKKSLPLVVALLLTCYFQLSTAFAQSPEKMSYQAVIRNSSDALVINQSVGMQISILQGSAGGTAVYVETQTPTTNANGLISIEIGAGTAVSGNIATIDWTSGPYFIKTETDPTGGTSYSITGTSQLLSVPYALHAKTADTVIGEITETDPVYSAWDKDYDDLINKPTIPTIPTAVSSFINDAGYLTSFTEVDGSVTNELQALSLSNDTIYLSNGGFVKLPASASGAETDPIFGASVASGITGVDTTNWNLDNDPTNEIQQLTVSFTGDTLHLQNGGFVIIPGISSANYPATYPPGTVHCLATPSAVVDVTNPITGKIWMDRNLGASQAATSSIDAASFGDLYQWGRRSDGHQCRISPTTTTLSSVDQPANGNFILALNFPNDWRSPQNTNLWQGVNGVNNPCPSGYRLPTEAELSAERTSWSSNNETGAFTSPLKLPVAGFRSGSNGTLSNVGTAGYYLSSTVIGTNARHLYFNSGSATMSSHVRANACSVRCIKN